MVFIDVASVSLCGFNCVSLVSISEFIGNFFQKDYNSGSSGSFKLTVSHILYVSPRSNTLSYLVSLETLAS